MINLLHNVYKKVAYSLNMKSGDKTPRGWLGLTCFFFCFMTKSEACTSRFFQIKKKKKKSATKSSAEDKCCTTVLEDVEPSQHREYAPQMRQSEIG